MANFSFSIDLLSLIGAQYVNGKKRPMRPGETPEQYAKVPTCPGIFIPCGSNEITVAQDNGDARFRNASGFTARLRLAMFNLRREYNQKLFDAVEARLRKDGKTIDDFSLPSHEVKTSYGEEYTQKLIAAAIAVEVLEHPEWSGLNLNDRGADGKYLHADFRSAVYAHIPSRLGLGYTLRPKDYVAPTPTSGVSVDPIAAGMSPAETSLGGEYNPTDDLPF